MTAYNRQKYIGASIEAVLTSTYTHFELIIVDDASTDDTVATVEQYLKKDSRIKLYVNEKNLGDYPNRNKAAGHALGKYIKYVDSDDIISPSGLETMVMSMEAFPAAGFGLSSLPAAEGKRYPCMLEPREAYEAHFFGPGLFHKGPGTAIFLRDAFNEVGGFKKDRMVSDVDMWHRMALHYHMVLMTETFVWTRKHRDQELALVNNYTLEYEKIKWQYLLHPLCPLNYSQVKIIKKQRLKKYAWFILSGVKNLNIRQVSDYIKCMQLVAGIKIYNK